MSYLFFLIRLFFYIPITFFFSLKVIFKNNIVFLDLDYSLCDNLAIQKRSNLYGTKPDYVNLNMPLRNEVFDYLENLDSCNYSITIFTARGLRSNFHTKKWLKKNNINFSSIFYLGFTFLKFFPILISIILSKKFILIDDLCDVKNGKLTRSFLHKIVKKLQVKNNFKWFDPQSKFFDEAP